MKRYWQYALFAISATLSMGTSVQAEVVSTKAADLIATDSSSEVSNQRKESEQNNFSIAQKADDANAKLPEKNYWYVSGSAGLGFARKINGTVSEGDFDLGKTSFGVKSSPEGSLAVGYQWEKYRAELEVNRSSNKLKNIDDGFELIELSKGRINSTAVSVNGYYDIPTGSKLRPYVGAGVGINFPGSTKLSVDEDTLTFSGGKSGLNLQGKVGVQYEVTKKGNIFAEAKYRHVAGNSSKSKDFEDLRINYNSTDNFSLNIGYRQGF
ncbi:MAG: outer membrane protein [Rivularia sp. (in: cyanobacteria)]